ncbi:MAG: hypothetical protein HY825_07345 [Acidobacteria bacterium]|nr:hypothetical protein [Acidobacteriota bacterium]
MACRHVTPAAANLPQGWEELKAPRPSFAALYRLECCGQHNLLATVRSGVGTLRLTVAAPPAGVVADAWLTADDGWFTRNQGRCVTPISARGVPLADGRWLPLDVEAVNVALSGGVAEAAEADPAAPGWLVLDVPGLSLTRWRVVGSPPLVVSVEVGKKGQAAFLQASLAEHHGRVPGRIAITAEGERASLVLVEWRSAAEPEPPAWLSATQCSEVP